MKSRPILTIGYVLILVLSGCIPAQRGTRITTVNHPASATSPSDTVRAVLQISQEDSPADKEALNQLYQRRPELAELAEQVAADPGNLERKRQLADAYLTEQLYLQAFRLYDELQSKNAADASLELGMAQIWHHWDDQAAARRYADSAIARDENLTAAWDLLGRIHLREKRIADALSAWRKASSLDPLNAVLASNIGYALLLAGNLANARTYLERAVSIDGSLAEAQNNLGIVLARIGDPEGALRHFMKVNAPAAAYNNLGVVYLAEGRKAEAIQQFKRAVELDPIYSVAVKNLAEAQADRPSPTIVELPPLPGDAVVAPVDVSQAIPVQAAPVQTTQTVPTPLVSTGAVGEARQRAALIGEAPARQRAALIDDSALFRESPKHAPAKNSTKPAPQSAGQGAGEASTSDVQEKTSQPAPEISHVSQPEPLRMSKRPDTNFYWMMFLTGGFGLAAAGELSKALRPGRQDWNRLKRFASLALIAGVLEVIALRLL
jgi:tetratricopeptide (TPR) repeat protein